MKRELVRLILTGLFCAGAAWVTRGRLVEAVDENGDHVAYMWSTTWGGLGPWRITAACAARYFTPDLWQIQQGGCVKRVGDRAVPVKCGD